MNLKKPRFWDAKKPNLIAYILLPFAHLLQFLNNLLKRNNPIKFKIKKVEEYQEIQENPPPQQEEQ